MRWPPKLRWNRQLRVRLLAWGVWLATVGVVIYLWTDTAERSPILGFVQGIEHRVAPTHAGRIQRVAVAPGQRVAAGQILAVLDPQELDAQRRIEQAELQRIRAAIVAASAEAQLTGTTALAKAQAEHRVKSAELEALNAQRVELKKLIAQGLVTKRDLVKLDLREGALQREVQAAAGAVQLARKQFGGPRPQGVAGGARAAAVERVVAPLKAELTVVERRLELLAAQREGMTLRAPSDGRIAVVYMREGDVARVGAPVVSLIADGAGQVIACVYENQAASLRAGTRVTLHPRTSARRTLGGHVVALSPAVEKLPQRCWPQPRQPVWGREMVILLDERADLVAGEAFNVRLHDTRPRDEGQAIAAPAKRGPTPAAIAVPGPLSQRSRFEPSGLIWIPRLARYVVVSDDTGQPDREDHAPWLFTMDARGRVDERPLRLEGIGELNDLESIAPGPGGALYALSSQSFSKRGKRKPSRQAFIKLEPANRGFRVTRAVRLAALLDAAPDGVRTALGVPSTRPLNIEGMTAYEGGLLIGLKAPVDAEGDAIIWRMRTPEQLLASGRLEDAGLERWARVTLRVKADGRSVPGGVAELLVLPDGGLLIAATASGLDPRQQSGSLWHAVPPPAAGGALHARLVRTFAGRKPEGLALSPHPGRVAVTFDAGQQAPYWVELPWPRR